MAAGARGGGTRTDRVLEVLFPEGGSQPFAPSSFYPALVGALFILAAIPPSRRMLRIGALLYAAALVGAYVLETAVGGNAERLGALFAGPVAACVLAARGRSARLLLVAVAPPLIYWQANAPVDDFLAAHSDPAVRSSYYAPLLGELRTLGSGYRGAPPASRWFRREPPGGSLGRAIHRARAGLGAPAGHARNDLFYEESKALTAARYRAWLNEQAVSYVALPDCTLDYSGVAEAQLLRGGLTGSWLLGEPTVSRPRERRRAICAKSGARHTGDCSRCSMRSHWRRRRRP